MKPALLFLALAGIACSRDPSRSNTPMDALPIDAKIRVTAAEALEWGYRHETDADLNGDGSAELLVLAADVSLSVDGTPLWEDGHRWGLVVSEGTGQKRRATLLYAAFVPNGFVEAALLAESASRSVLVQQRTPHELRAYAIAYEGPNQARTVSGANYSIERWLPGAAVPPGSPS